MKILYELLLRILWILYALVYGILLLSFFWLLWPLQKMNLEPMFFYKMNYNIARWFNNKINK